MFYNLSFGIDIFFCCITGLGLPEDLALDWVTQNIYFTDSQKKHIGVCNSDGSYCSVLVNEDIDQPRSLALLPSKRLVL